MAQSHKKWKRCLLILYFTLWVYLLYWNMIYTLRFSPRPLKREREWEGRREGRKEGRKFIKRERLSIFFKIFFLPLGAKCNFWNLLGYLQGMPYHILAYHLFTIPWNVHIHGFQGTRLLKKTSFFDPYLNPGMKIKIL